jgi:hypothetical protein
MQAKIPKAFAPIAATQSWFVEHSISVVAPGEGG